MSELAFEIKSANNNAWMGCMPADADKLAASITARKEAPRLAGLSELDLVRHYTGLSRKNFCVDGNFYPLGSCTMKYNPKMLDTLSALEGLTQIHPYQQEEQVQGALGLLFETQRLLSEIAGMDEFTLQPAAGAHGELCGLLMIGAYLRDKGQHRKKVLVPDSSHGTNPASAALCGFEIVQVGTDPKGHIDLDDLKAKIDTDIACLMMTNPNTLGIFEGSIDTVAKWVHQAGGLLYYDGANMNALMGLCRPGDMGFDVIHLNLHKTFAVPHGSGGPGSGPVGVKKPLIPYLPKPRIVKRGELLSFDESSERSVGKMRSFYGNFTAVVRAYAYILALGREGLKEASETAILSANYLKKQLEALYDVPYQSAYCMHEFVMSARRQKRKGVRALDIAKRLLDYGYHAPTVYFPLIVEEAMMVEPTETESKATLDGFVEVLKRIENEIDQNPQKVLEAPSTTPVGRIDEVLAARQMDLRYKPSTS